MKPELKDGLKQSSSKVGQMNNVSSMHFLHAIHIKSAAESMCVHTHKNTFTASVFNQIPREGAYS